MNLYYKKILFLAWISVLLVLHASGQQQPIVAATPLKGDSVKIGKHLIVQDSVYLDEDDNDHIAQTKSVDNILSLYINEFLTAKIPDTFHVVVRVQLDYTTTTGPGTKEDTLIIFYSKDHPYTAKAIKHYQNYESLDAEILSLVITGADDTTLVKKFLVMENMISVNRSFTTTCAVVGSVGKDVSYVDTKGELRVYWAAQDFIPAYDLQWTYIDSSAIEDGIYVTGGSLDPALIFKNNSSRVIVSGNSYMIPLLYDGSGAVYFRVRTVQYAPDGEAIFGNWSSGTSNLGSHGYRGHERLLNWQATTSYAEEGKRKSVVQYFDGSLKGRQTVTKDNTTDNTIVAETLYDKQGRAVIQVLPAPTLSSLISYTPLFNVRDINSAEYDKSVYDTLINSNEYCSGITDSMSVANGAARYYSPVNPLASTSYHQYIPDAKGYAFAETRYTRDNTGRIDRQGGVGENMQIGSGHETKYFYGSPTQKVLDALFGTEAGDATHYEKNMVQDANGQYSVSYVDMHGRTVATALAGDTIISRQYRLPSYNSINQTEQLLTATNNIIKDNGIRSFSSILVPKAGNYTFNYVVKPESLEIAGCDDTTVCYDCLYDLTITISDNCNNEQFGGSPKVITRKNFSLYKTDGVTHNIDTTCAVADSIKVTEIIGLEEGSYDITKVLTLSKEGMKYYRDSLFLPHNTCKSFAQLVLEQLDSMRQHMDCTPDTYKVNVVAAFRDQMIADLMPLTGQYADTATQRDCQSIFATVIVDGREKYLYQTLSGYKDEEGNADQVSQFNGTTWEMVTPEFLTPEEFIANYKDSWGETLLPLHPEYDLLVEYEKLKSAYNWEAEFIQTETYAEAVAKGYLNPTGSNNQPASQYSVSGQTDSLFIALSINDPSKESVAKSAIENALFNYILVNNDPPQYYNLWGAVTGIVKCNSGDTSCYGKWSRATNPFNTDSLCTPDLDMAWRLFRGQYLRIREDWIDNYTRDKTGIYSWMFSDNCIAVFPAQDITAATQNSPYGGLTGAVTDSTTIRNNINSYFSDNCTAYATQWWEELKPCGYTEADSLAIIPLLIQVCKEGSDRNHPFGASTVRPSSTNTNRSFEQVIEEYNASHYTGPDAKDPLACNAYLMSRPKPYDQPGMIVNQPIIARPDNCTCDRINELYNQYLSNASEFSSFSNYLQVVHGTIISQGKLDTLRNLCNNTSSCRYLEKPILLPPALQCGPISACTTCSEVRSLYESFKDKFPEANPTIEEPDSAAHHVNQVFANYMNHHLGFSKQAHEYLIFMESCPETPTVQCDSTRWTVYNPGTNLLINADLYTNAYNNIPPDNAQFFSNGHFNSPTALQTSHYVLVNKKDSLVADTITLMMQWRVQLDGYPGMTDPFVQRGSNITYVGAEWVQDPMDNNWWIGATILRGEHGSVIKGMGLASNHHGLKADWVKITNPATSEVLYFQDFSATGLCGEGSGPFLCGIQAADSIIKINVSECADTTLFAIQNATYLFDLYTKKIKGEFERSYSSKCMDAGKLESFTVTHPLTEYHYTLYYYDQAGNLIKTVPPAGVHLRRDSLWLDSVKNYRAANQPLAARHTLATTYRYNSLNQVITQHSPDGGLSKFWYDRLGRLVVSQNAKQAAENKYSYTIYDELGRITEVGQKEQATAIADTITRNNSKLNTWLNYTYTFDGSTVVAEQVTSTIYDVTDDQVRSALGSSGNIVNNTFQKPYTLRNRVSFTKFYEKLTWASGQPVYSQYDNSSVYSYDIHGNVDTLLHYYRTGMIGHNAFKAIAYKYDLVSGKVNEVHYQPGMPDQFYHRYEYDAENRLTDVYTTDRKELLGIPALEEHEARYNYYRHGPLARTVLGQQLVQGIDYAYTLQGWLKGVNGDSLLDQDAKNTAADAYRFSLNYFNGDYLSIGTAVKNVVFAGHSGQLPNGDYRPLYNGNISSMVVGIPQLGETRLYNYAYDQLNRLVKMDAYTGYNSASHTWGTLDSHGGEYKERIAYDPNGNILKYLRNGRAGKVQMDSLSYYYNRDDSDYLTDNRLRHVKDAVGDNSYTVSTDDIADIDGQPDDNYKYDAIGNLTKDTKEGIDTVLWTVYGKIREITKADGTVIHYTYDVAGNRISKAVTKNSSTTTTWYARDAQGNPMAIYTSTGSGLTLSEHHLYGNSRLGVWNRNVDMDAGPGIKNYTYERGNKFFELSNHLGNVLVTISDKKFAFCPDPDESFGCGVDHLGQPQTCPCSVSQTAHYYRPDVVTANDYYPFGMIQPGRKFSAGSLYRYGFNGKENDNDVKGEGNQQDYGMRIYDPRVGRFLSVDPITKKYPMLTPYQFAANSPIQGVDLDGLELLPVNSSMYRSTIRANHPKGYQPPPIPFVSDLVTEQTIVVVESNVSSSFKDANGIPFSGLNVDIKRFQPNQPTLKDGFAQTSVTLSDDEGAVISDPDSHYLPAPPPWPWSASDAADAMEPSSSTEASVVIQRTQYKGTQNAWHYWEYGPSNATSPLANGISGAGEIQKYVGLYSNDLPLWNAYSKMGNDGRALYQALQITHDAFQLNQKANDWFNGLQNKSDYTNYILDGTLPSCVDPKENGNNYWETLNRRIIIQFYGIQNLKARGKLSSTALETYKHDIDEYEQTNPGSNNNFRSAYE